jgi:hypothetical protein
METPTLKKIIYRGGVVSFRVPADWAEEYDNGGEGVYYKPGDNTGTLGLNVLTGTVPAGRLATEGYLAEQLKADSVKYGVAIEPLGESAVMIRYDMPGRERGQSIKIRCWRIFQALPPNNFRHVLFTYTLLAEQFDQQGFVLEMESLDREIAVVELAPTLGQLPSPKKPWWRPW